MSKPAVLGFNNPQPDDDFLKLIEEFSPYGVILFERNFFDLDSIVENIIELKSASPNSLIMIDEEGGEKSRIRREHGFPNPPDPREVAMTMSLAEAEEAYRILGRALAELGVDVDLAPVVDVAPPDHILGNRAFYYDCRICADYSAAVIRGLRRGGVMSCAKHFPGLGSAVIDPHLATAVTTATAEDFAETHFPPFESAVSADVDFLMTTHLRAESLDSTGEIATLSPKIVSMIRKRGFRGKILTDDLLMGGASGCDNLSELASKALSAGHSAVLICRQTEDIRNVMESLPDMKLDG
ncbi:MAG: glycoside hydrolase family 3 N-terminal domain-containing protein [bacterium]